MATITRVSPSPDMSTCQLLPQPYSGLLAGEALLAVQPLYIKTSDGKLYKSNGTSANEAAEFVGFSARACDAGEPVTVFGLGARFRYGSGMSPGALLYVSATGGALDDAATTGGLAPVAIVVNATDIACIAASGWTLPAEA
ncbi:MAG TPA: hypothetical protein VEB19_06185 [Gemmatimonadaceae bacterium]|nr:hypothetical protein [Gemmatimonadaceae bacterium]